MCEKCTYHTTPIRERFRQKVNTNGPIIKPELGPCHIWTGATDKDGYGRFSMSSEGGGMSEPAYRIAFVWENGPLEPGYQPDHLCDNHPCVRPDHMKAVPRHINIGRGKRKLTEDQVHEIRRLLKQGVTKAEIARRFNVTYMTITFIERKKSWAWLEEVAIVRVL